MQTVCLAGADWLTGLDTVGAGADAVDGWGEAVVVCAPSVAGRLVVSLLADTAAACAEPMKKPVAR